MGETDSGEYSGQTRFLTMQEIFEATSFYKRIRFELVDDFDALVLMTDGITDAWFHTDANLLKTEKWDQLFQEIQKEVTLSRDNENAHNQLLQWLDFWVKGEYDDRTIAILFNYGKHHQNKGSRWLRRRVCERHDRSGWHEGCIL